MKESDLWGLPLSLQAQLRRSEREFLEALCHMGLDRHSLAAMVERAHHRLERRSLVSGRTDRRIRHV
jgi:hypothetical protein